MSVACVLGDIHVCMYIDAESSMCVHETWCIIFLKVQHIYQYNQGNEDLKIIL